MALLDFTEIPDAGKATGKQDTFELFAREVLDLLGFRILQGPARGPDVGKDLIVEETRVGLIDATRVRWLVSCKHFAFSGKSVRPDDEQNVLERVNAAGCQGFIGFYSTLPSSGLSELLHRQSAVAIKFFDREEIERYLLSSPEGRSITERYFPASSKNLRLPADVFSDSVPLTCEYCGKDLLDPPSGIWVLWHADKQSDDGSHAERYVDLHFACKGHCDQIVQQQVRSKHVMLDFIHDGWDDIPDMTVPTIYIKKVMAFLNGLAAGDDYEPEAFEKLKHLLLAMFPLVARHMNPNDEKTLRRLQRIPSYLGGMGYDG